MKSSFFFYLILTCSRTAAAFWAAGAADEAAASVRATLAPADPNQKKEQKEAQNYQKNQ